MGDEDDHDACLRSPEAMQKAAMDMRKKPQSKLAVRACPGFGSGQGDGALN